MPKTPRVHHLTITRLSPNEWSGKCSCGQKMMTHSEFYVHDWWDRKHTVTPPDTRDRKITRHS